MSKYESMSNLEDIVSMVNEEVLEKLKLIWNQSQYSLMTQFSLRQVSPKILTN